MTYANAWAVLADPTRRAVLERLRRGPASVGEVAAGLPVSRPAVSQHLKVLTLAGLVTHHAHGTRHIYSVDPQGFGELRRWLGQFWDEALAAFQSEVEAPQAPDARSRR